MNANNLEQLKLEMEKLGFSGELIGEMEQHMARNEPRFILYQALEAEKGRMELGLHFNQSKSSEFYYFNKFDLVLEKQAPLDLGEQYFVRSQRQGEQERVVEFQMPSLAVKEFNYRLEAAKEIRGTAELAVGTDLGAARMLAVMADGKLVDLDKDFYKTLKNPSPAQTFYIEKGNGFSLEQAVNMLQGRSVYRGDILNVEKNEYSAWAKLDFNGEKERSGNYPMKTFTGAYGYDLSAVLDRFDFKELGKADLREAVELSLRNGNRVEVTVQLDGKDAKVLLEAVPEFKQVNIYALDGRSIKREDHLKKEQPQELSIDKAKGQRKDASQQQGLGI